METRHGIDSEQYEYYVLRLSDRLRNLRQEKKLSQEEVAYRSGISAYTYQKFEKGESKPGTPMNPRLDTLLSLARTFDVDVRDLLDFRTSTNCRD